MHRPLEPYASPAAGLGGALLNPAEAMLDIATPRNALPLLASCLRGLRLSVLEHHFCEAARARVNLRRPEWPHRQRDGEVVHPQAPE